MNRWDVWAVHETGDKRDGWDPGSPRLNNDARFWNSADRIVEGITEGGEHGPQTDAGSFPISVVFPPQTGQRETQTCFKAPANTIGMRWFFADGGTIGWDDLIDVRIPANSTDEYSLCTSRLTMTKDVMYLLALPYSNVVEADWHDDWLSGYGPQSIFVYNARSCGSVSEECCAGSASCVDGAICQSGICQSCGYYDEPCCAENKCGAGHSICGARGCESCGLAGEQCCEQSLCTSGNVCRSNGKCTPCGDAGQPCCRDKSCTAPNTQCRNDSCEAIQRCNSTLHAGMNAPSSYEIEMGQNEGQTQLLVNTFSVPDDIRIYYEGEPIRGTGCFGTNSLSGCTTSVFGTACCDGTGLCSIPVSYGPGTSTSLVVEVIPNCSGTADTQWEFTLACPD